LRVALSHAFDKLGSDLGADSGRRLNLIRLQVNHFLHRIGQSADHRRLAFNQHLHHDDAGVDGLFCLRHLERQSQIDHGHNSAA